MGGSRKRHHSGLGRWKPEEGIQGSVVFIGSISSQGIPGQIAYASTKAGLEGAEATLTKEAIFHGVHSAIVHPGFTNTPMVRVLGEEYIKKNILPYTRLGRLIEPSEIADTICFLISNSEVSGRLLSRRRLACAFLNHSCPMSAGTLTGAVPAKHWSFCASPSKRSRSSPISAN